MTGLENEILNDPARSLGFPWAAVIPALITASAGVATAAIAARTAKKNNEAAKELAAMNLAQQQQASQAATNIFAQNQAANTTATPQKDNTMLYAAMIALALVLVLKK